MQYTKKCIIDGEALGVRQRSCRFQHAKKEGGSFAAALQNALRRERINAIYKPLIYCEKYSIEHKFYPNLGIRGKCSVLSDYCTCVFH
jgi:hypothetical protein